MLPHAFLMHPLSVGLASINGKSLLMTANRSRASTGRVFLAIYTTDGGLLYRNVLSSGQLWDAAIVQDAVVLVGCGESRVLRVLDNETSERRP